MSVIRSMVIHPDKEVLLALLSHFEQSEADRDLVQSLLLTTDLNDISVLTLLGETLDQHQDQAVIVALQKVVGAQWLADHGLEFSSDKLNGTITQIDLT